MAKYKLTYTADGVEKKELKYKNKIFSYSMIPDDFGKTGDNKSFDLQVAEKFENEKEIVLDALSELGFAEANEIQEILSLLEEHEHEDEEIPLKKYLAWAESETNNELWFLIDAESKREAERFVMEEEEVIEIRACLKVKPNKKSGISHKFTLYE